MQKLLMFLSVAVLCSQGFAGYSVIWSVPGFDPYKSSLFSDNAVNHDVNGDGQPDVFVSDGTRLLVLDGAGNTLWDITLPSPYEVWRNYVPPFHICNTDGDPANELVVEVHRLDGPTLYYGFAIYDCESHELEYTSPDAVFYGHGISVFSVVDLDNDGRKEICRLAGDGTRTLEVFDWTAGGVDEGAGSPPVPGRSRAVPNPARGDVRFSVRRSAAGSFDVVIADVAGRVVRKMRVDGRPGDNSVAWDGRDDSGTPVPCGTYAYWAGGDAGSLELVR